MKKVTTVSLSILILIPLFIGALNENMHYRLPPPLEVNLPVEQAICRRMSIRDFTDEGVSDENLSTVLWAAYGFSENRRNIHGIGMTYAVHIYILKEEGVYKYDALNHSLLFMKAGDFRWVGQYDTAPIKIGIVWDSNKCSNEEIVCSEIGEIGQNIYLMANALHLGTVTTASEVNQLKIIGIPLWEKPKIIMPLGYPKDAYNFTYSPLPSVLPVITNSSISLSRGISNRKIAIAWEDKIKTHEQNQLVWASYGYSFLMDNVNEKRHRTVPSSHGTYPLRIHIANISGLYEYLPEEHQMMNTAKGDHRNEIAIASHSFISTSPLIIIIGLNYTMIDEKYLWPWYYEAGASAYNILLEATAWNLSANIIIPKDTDTITTLLNLDETYRPLFIVPVGKEKKVSDTYPPNISLQKPREGHLYIFNREIVPMFTTLIIGHCTAIAEVIDNYAVQVVKFFIDGNAIEETFSEPYTCKMPSSFIPRNHVIEIRAYDFKGNSAFLSLEYMKII